MSPPFFSKDPYSPIGIFDSGLGGLTVVQQIMRCLPHEQICYFGDTARMPYGEKSCDAIERYSIENTLFLMNQHVKLLIVACNTAAVHSTELRKLFNVPIVDVIEAGVEQAIRITKNRSIAVLGTKGTIRSGIYEREIFSRLPGSKLTAIACPLWASLVEENFADHPATQLIVREYLKPLHDSDIDTLLLGCTHYPLLKRWIQKELPHVKIVDSAENCAAKVTAVLIERQLQAKKGVEKPDHLFYVSDDPQRFSQMATTFLGYPVTTQLASGLTKYSAMESDLACPVI